MISTRLLNITLVLSTLLTSLLFACSTDKIVAKKVSKEFKNNDVIQQYQVGFALYNLDEKKRWYKIYLNASLHNKLAHFV